MRADAEMDARPGRSTCRSVPRVPSRRGGARCTAARSRPRRWAATSWTRSLVEGRPLGLRGRRLRPRSAGGDAHGPAEGEPAHAPAGAGRPRRGPGRPNDVLEELTRPNTFATAAVLALESRTRLAYGPGRPSARSCTGGAPTARSSAWARGAWPSGFAPGSATRWRHADVAAGDVLAVLTDGFTRDDGSRGPRAGLEPIEAALAANAREPLPELLDRLLSLARAHGPQQDDRTLLADSRARGLRASHEPPSAARCAGSLAARVPRQPRAGRRGTTREARSLGSRVTRGTLWTTLVAAISSSAGSLRTSRRVLSRAISAVIGQTWTAASVRTTSGSSRSTSMRPRASLAISHSRSRRSSAGPGGERAAGSQSAGDGVEQDVGVKVEHPSRPPSRRCLP